MITMTIRGNNDSDVRVNALNPDAFAERVNQLVKRFGGASNLARTCGVSESVIRKWKSGKSEPNREHLVRLAGGAGVSLEWLATGEGSPDRYQNASGQDMALGCNQASLEDEYALIPLYDVRAAAGHGAVVENEQVIDYLAFKRDWLRRELRAGPNDLYLIEVDGESMEPTLRPGDVILVDRRDAQDVPRDGIYILRMDSGLLVKRLQRLPGRRIRVTSDNPAYQPFEVALDESTADLAIIGRVVWAGRRV